MANEKEIEELKNMITTQFEKYDKLNIKVINHDKDIEHINKDLIEFRNDAKGSLKDIASEMAKIKDFIVDQVGDLYEHVKREIKSIRDDLEKKIDGIRKSQNKIVFGAVGVIIAILIEIILRLVFK